MALRDVLVYALTLFCGKNDTTAPTSHCSFLKRFISVHQSYSVFTEVVGSHHLMGED